MPIRTVALFVLMLSGTACEHRAPTSPTLGNEPSLTPSVQIPAPTSGASANAPRQPMPFEITGRVTGDEGRPVAGAKVTIILDVGEWYGPNPWVLTDASGRYRVNFMGVPGSNHYPGVDPPDTQEAVGFVLVEASGYDWYSGYILGTTEHLVEDLPLRRIQRITAGESAVLTVGPDDKVCASDAWPWRGLICGTLRVVAPRDGTMTVEAVPSQGGSQLATLEVWSDRTGGRGNPVSISVVAGTEYTVNVEVAWGISATQSFIVKTSM